MIEMPSMPTPASSPSPLSSICVFCGSNPGTHPAYIEGATALGTLLAQSGIRLVYGGGGSGLMGASARAAHAAGGDVLGIIPEFLREAEKAMTEVPHRIVPDMHTRKTQMYEESDAFIVLPGGIGTLEEAIEILSWLRLSLHQKPVVFLEQNAFWTPIVQLLDHTINEGFTPADLRHHYGLVKTPEAALSFIKQRVNTPLAPIPLRIKADISHL